MHPQGPDPDTWFPLVLACIFNAGDFIGRAAAGQCPNSLSLRLLLFLATLRLFLVPLWVRLAASPTSFGDRHDAVTYLTMAVTSLSNGFLASVAIMRAPGEFSEASLKEKSSTVMVLALTLGLALGSVFALPVGAWVDSGGKMPIVSML